jgi:hypothetical protein
MNPGAQPPPEGWYGDPFRRHEQRWFSAGTPTALVRDRGVESLDEPPDLAARPPPNGPAAGSQFAPGPPRQTTPAGPLPQPIIRPGIDPPGLRFTLGMGRDGVYLWRFPMLGLGAAIVIELWQGLNPLTWDFMLIYALLALVPLLEVGHVLRNRLLTRAVWRTAARHDPSVLPLLANWRLIRAGEYVRAVIVLGEAAALTGLIAHQLSRMPVH